MAGGGATDAVGAVAAEAALTLAAAVAAAIAVVPVLALYREVRDDAGRVAAGLPFLTTTNRSFTR